MVASNLSGLTVLFKNSARFVRIRFDLPFSVRVLVGSNAFRLTFPLNSFASFKSVLTYLSL